MRGSFRIARIMGIDISVDLSWFIILFLMVYSLGFFEFPRELYPRTFFPRADVLSVTLGIVTSLLLFASVLAHELSHSWMAIQRGIPVMNITLFIFGGVAQIADEPDRPASEFLIAIMGPLMSVALAAVFGAAWLWLQIIENFNFALPLTPLILLTGLLAQANGALALFNLAPGFPLDGGRVFRAILWAILRDVRRATRIATRAGQLIALILIGFGGWLFLTEFEINGIWYILIAFFLWNAAGQGYRQTVVRETLRDVRVAQLMTREVQVVAPDISMASFVTEYLIPRREQTFAVSDGRALLGTITLNHAQRVPRDRWAARCVRDEMTPRARLSVLEPQQTAAAALGLLSRAGADELPVVEDGQLVGFLGRRELTRFLNLKIELKTR
ncbi:MAG: site-2 protease family protein [Chloroflexi bacterium]|nr:site-2 protease family protein [Chloroflexota bacterium]